MTKLSPLTQEAPRHIQFAPSSEVPEISPRFTISSNLERKLSYFWFDTQGYVDLLRNEGVSDEQIRELSIDFKSYSPRRKGFSGARMGGHYNPKHSRVTVFVESCLEQSNAKLQEVVLHETGHFVDDRVHHGMEGWSKASVPKVLGGTALSSAVALIASHQSGELQGIGIGAAGLVYAGCVIPEIVANFKGIMNYSVEQQQESEARADMFAASYRGSEGPLILAHLK